MGEYKIVNNQIYMVVNGCTIKRVDPEDVIKDANRYNFLKHSTWSKNLIEAIFSIMLEYPNSATALDTLIDLENSKEN